MEPAPPQPERNRAVSYNLFASRVRAFVGTEVWNAHTDHFLPVGHTEVGRTMLISIVIMVLTFIETECRAEASTPAGLQLENVLSLLSMIIRVFQVLPTATTIVKERKQGSVEPLCRGVGGDEKKCVTFSYVQLLTQLLTESRTVRQACIRSSEEWKTGALHNQVPQVYGDVTHGSRFRSSDMCKAATPIERNDLRIAAHPWNDAFTSVDGMKQKAAENNTRSCSFRSSTCRSSCGTTSTTFS